MSAMYNMYITNHQMNVLNGYTWLQDNIPELADDLRDAEENIRHHDSSKYDRDEYDAYDAYFYSGNRSYQVVEDFRLAWLNHIHKNPHHWQHWILINDRPEEGELILEMPNRYVIEMICDWWSFSLDKGNPYEIFNWYDAHKDYMKLHRGTRVYVEMILGSIKKRLEELDA